MLNKIKAVLNNGTLMKRIGFTVLILFVFTICTFIPIPLVNKGFFANQEGSFLDFVNAFAGGGLQNFAITALGISPYITSSIVIQLLQMDIIPKFKEWSEQGEVGKQKLNQVTRYFALILAALNSLVLLLGLSGGNISTVMSASLTGWEINFAFAFIIVVMIAGTAFVMWLADLITRKGVGNGSSLIIAAGILFTLPSACESLWNQFVYIDGAYTEDALSIWTFVLIIFLYFAVLVAVVYTQLANRKIPVQYANRQGKSDSSIPMKINSAGVIPVIFAATILSLPSQLIGMFCKGDLVDGAYTLNSAGYWLNMIFANTEPIGFVIYVILIFLFTFFYAFITVNPEKMADNLSKQNAYIPGVKPGDETHGFLSRLLFKITIIGSTALVLLAIIPIIMSAIFTLDASVTIGGTSLLIIVGVAIETVKQIETDAEEQTYSGFLK